MVEWVENVMNQQWDDPMFLAAGIFKPHLPFYAPPATFKKYPFNETNMPPMPENDLDDVPPAAVKMAHTEFFIYQNTTKKPVNSLGGLKKMVQCYQASADFADQMVGRLIDKLDASGKADNTIIVLWADHGYHLGDKESCVKFTLWEKANHVPFIIVAPGVTKPGTRCDRPGSWQNLSAGFGCPLACSGTNTKTEPDNCTNTVKIQCGPSGFCYYRYFYNSTQIGKCPYNNGVNWWRYKKTKNDDRFYSTWYRSRDPDNDGSAADEGTKDKYDWVVWKYNCIDGIGPDEHCREHPTSVGDENFGDPSACE